MSITLLRGLPGTGKSSRLITLVNESLAHGRPVLTFACADSPWLRAREAVRDQRVLGCRIPGLVCPLHHFVPTAEAAALLAGVPAGTLVAFEEAHAFGAEIVPHWLDASERGLDVLVAMPSVPQLALLKGHDYTESVLVTTCQRCAGAPATSFIVVPREYAVGVLGEGAFLATGEAVVTLTLCQGCDQALTEAARREILERLEKQPPYPGEKVIYQPVELAECADWRVLRPESSRRVEVMTRINAELGLVDVYRRDAASYLDVGCNTGFFCHRMRRLGYYAEGVDVVEGDIAVARLLDSFVRRDRVSYVAANAYDYLRDTQERRFDVVSAFAVFQWLMIQQSAEHGIAALRWTFAKCRRACFIEMGYSSEAQYKEKLPIGIDRAWVLNLMVDSGEFAEVRVLPAGDAHGLSRDLFVGLKAPG